MLLRFKLAWRKKVCTLTSCVFKVCGLGLICWFVNNEYCSPHFDCMHSALSWGESMPDRLFCCIDLQGSPPIMQSCNHAFEHHANALLNKVLKLFTIVAHLKVYHELMEYFHYLFTMMEKAWKLRRNVVFLMHVRLHLQMLGCMSLGCCSI